MVYGETDRFELDLLISKRAILHWYKCVTGCGMTWSDHMYCMMYSLYVRSMVQLPWLTYIHNTICNLELNYVWVLEGHGRTINMLKTLVHQVSLDQFIQKWRSEVANSSKCLCYRIYNKILA